MLEWCMFCIVPSLVYSLCSCSRDIANYIPKEETKPQRSDSHQHNLISFLLSVNKFILCVKYIGT